MTNHSIWSLWSFFRFLYSNIADSKSHKQKWHVLFFTHIKLVACVLVCVRIKLRRLGPYGDVNGSAGFFKIIFFAPKMGKIGLKWDFMILLENRVINFSWIWCIMEIHFICYIPAQIPYSEKVLLLRYRPKCSLPSRLQDF